MTQVLVNKIKDPISALTHFCGFIASIPITFALVYNAIKEGNIVLVFAFMIFGFSLMLLYGASTVYHTVKTDPKYTAILRRIDHMMIFVLIAGTYTPVCLISLKGSVGNILLITVWSIAFLGLFLKIFWLNAPRFLSTAIYVVMGWLVVIAFVPLSKAIPFDGILMLTAGGVTYTIGALIYALKSEIFHLKHLNFHDIFHIFVLFGSLFHILFMFLYVL